jgi:hypothetical protein
MAQDHWWESFETLDDSDYRINDIHFTQGAVLQSRQFSDLDELKTFLENDSPEYTWPPHDRSVWTHLEGDLSRLGEVYQAYQRRYSGEMSFYVAGESNKLYVLLRVGRAGGRRRSEDAPPSVLWAYIP